MKDILIVTVVAISLFLPKANAQSTEEVLGAIAGAALGSTIGDGDGRKAATVIGAIIGYRMGERVLGGNERNEFLELNAQDFRHFCRHEVPYRYNQDRRLRERWVNGCVARLHRQQRELEREAYNDGYYNGPTN